MPVVNYVFWVCGVVSVLHLRPEVNGVAWVRAQNPALQRRVEAVRSTARPLIAGVAGGQSENDVPLGVRKPSDPSRNVSLDLSQATGVCEIVFSYKQDIEATSEALGVDGVRGIRGLL